MAGFQYTSQIVNAVLNELFTLGKVISADQLSTIILEIDKKYKDLTGKDLLFEKPIKARICEDGSAKPRLVSIIDFFDGPYNKVTVFMTPPNRKSTMANYKTGSDRALSEAIYTVLVHFLWGWI